MPKFAVAISGLDRPIACPDDKSVLDACIEAGVAMPYNCRSGECGECIATLTDGSIEEMPGADPAVFTDAERRQGRILTCMCFPRSDISLEIALRDGIQAPAIQHVNAVVEDILWHGPHIAEVAVATPGALDYRPGQYFEWVLPGIEPNRCFSVANRPGEDVVRFHVRIYPQGKVGEFVRESMHQGAVLGLIGPYGHFGFTDNDHRPAICVAGGTGMAPIQAALDATFAKGNKRPIHYFYGARTRADLYCMEKMATWAAAHSSFTFTPVLSEEPAGSDWTGERGLVTETLQTAMPDAFGAEAYLCGPPAMIDAALEILFAAGLAEEDAYFDKFTPTK